MTQSLTISRTLFYYCGIVILAALLIGGSSAQGLWTDHLLYVLFMPLVLIGFGGIANTRVEPLVAIGVFVMLMVLALQFVPGFGGISATGQALFKAPALGRTVEATIFTITLTGFMLFVARLSDLDQSRFVRFFLIGLSANLVIAFIQRSYSDARAVIPLLPYETLGGMFANENHFSALAYCGIVLAGFQFLYLSKSKLLFFGSLTMIILILFAVQSRAAMALSIAMAILSLLVFTGMKRSPMRSTALLLLMLSIAGAFAWMRREVILYDGRVTFFANTWDAMVANFPFGSGLGSFVLIYPLYEKDNLITVGFVNQAHNDWLQLGLELGLPFMLLAAVFIVALLQARYREELSSMALLIIGALALHSLVDFPLRTVGMATLFAYAVGVALSSKPHFTPGVTTGAGSSAATERNRQLIAPLILQEKNKLT